MISAALLAVGATDWGDSIVAADLATAVVEDVKTAEYVASEGDQQSHVVPAAHSAGRTAPKLEWLPVGPDRSATPTRSSAPLRPLSSIQAAQFTLPVPDSAVPAGVADPFDDPFEDAKKMARRDTALKPLDDRAFQGSRPLAPAQSLPQLSAAIDTPKESKTLQRGRQLDDLLAGNANADVQDCRTPADLKAINQLGYDITPPDGTFPRECPIGDGQFEARVWAPTTFMWKASGLYHKPAYFDDVHLERYGHSTGPYTQPLVSAAHFFLTVPILPYKMGLNPPGENMYTLGYYRPGNCAPYLLDPLPLSIRAAVAEAGVWTGMAFLIP